LWPHPLWQGARLVACSLLHELGQKVPSLRVADGSVAAALSPAQWSVCFPHSPRHSEILAIWVFAMLCFQVHRLVASRSRGTFPVHLPPKVIRLRGSGCTFKKKVSEVNVMLPWTKNT
jgi:hypothetical protein